MAQYGDTVRGGWVWTDERIARAKRLWADGLTATQIANDLGGGISRNAVISKLHREGCAARAFTSRSAQSKRHANAKPKRPRAVANSNAPKKPAAVKVRFLPPADLAGVEELVIPAHERRTIADLESCHCKWPIGDPQRPGFHFCGRERLKDHGLPYCQFHCSKAYQPRSGPSPKVIDPGWNHTRVLVIPHAKTA